MSERLIDPKSPDARMAPDYLRHRALRQNKQLLQIVWDEAGGYPAHAWGFIQWSTRPFTQRQGCDGTIEDNVYLIGFKLCETLGLNFADLHRQAYADRDRDYDNSWINADYLSKFEKETVVPELSEQALKGLLYDLEDINHSTLLNILIDEFVALGYNVEDFWKED